MSTERNARLYELYHAALSLAPAERAAFLDQACASDPALRRELEALLALDEPATGEVLRPLFAEAPGGLGEGERLGPYTILRRLGEGGMGVVYLAEHEELPRQVALKLMRYGRLASPAQVQRFLHERRLLARLDHPHIARLFDAGLTEQGVPYFTMEYVEGEPLTGYSDRHRLGIDARLALFLDVCAAVQYAHRNLVVHRDLKPSNVLVTEAGTVKLLDFGIAKALADEPGQAALTRTGEQVLTPEYAAPEQIRGEAVTTATDVYALGVVLYELLSGHRPYEVAARPPSEIERVICQEPPPKPSTMVRRKTRHDEAATREVGVARQMTAARLQRCLGGDLDTIVLKALRKEPERRYASAEELAADLRSFRAGLPVSARRDTPWYGARTFARRHRAGLAMTAVVLALLVGGGVLHAVRVTQERNRAERAAAHAQLEAEKARQVSAFLVDLFEMSDPGEALGDTLTARAVLDRGAERVEAELASQPAVQATMLDAIGRVYQNLGLYADATTLLERALALRRRVLDAPHPEIAESLHHLAHLRARRGAYEAADSLARATLDMRQALFGEAHPEVAASLNLLAYTLHQRRDHDAAEPLYREALDLRRGLLPADHPDITESLNNLALLLKQTGDHAAAEPLYREALARNRATYGEKHPEIAVNLNNLALLLRDRGRYDEAEPLFREALAINQGLYGAEHPEVVRSLNNLAVLLRDRGAYDEAEPLLRRAIALNRELLGPEHPHVAFSQYNLGRLFEETGDVDAAEPLYRAALALLRETFGEGHLYASYPLVGLGGVRRARGNLQAADSLHRQALAIREQALPAGHPLVAEAQQALGTTLLAAGRYEAAEPLLLASYETFRDREEGSPKALTDALRRLVTLYERWGRPEEAAAYRARLIEPAGSDDAQLSP